MGRLLNQFEKHFTVKEANALLPQIVSIFERIGALREELDERQTDLEGVHRAAPGNGGHHDGPELVTRSEMIGRLLLEVENLGAVVKDPDSGLIDFPHLRDGQEVFLCWKLGEKSVAHWHELDAGFQGRQSL